MGENILKGRTALVTGAGRRLGRSIALALAGAGVNLVLHCNSSVQEAESVKDEALSLGRGAGIRVCVLRADFSLSGGAQGLIDSALELNGNLNMLVNSASIFPRGTLADITFDDLKSNLKVNTWAPLILSRSFAAAVKEGSIVNLLDTRIAGFDRAHVAYHMSKHLLALLTSLCAVELAPAVTVNGVAPGLVLPPVDMDDEKTIDTDFMERMAAGLPLKRFGSPEDVVEAVLFLLSSSFITGQIIYVDGGRHVREGSYG